MPDDVRQNPDHESLSQLARDDPAAFEALRVELIHDLIDHAPDTVRRRLEGLQFRLDAIHRNASNPLGATVKVYQMMWRSFLQLRHELVTFREPVEAPQRNAQILDFRPRKALSA